MVATDRDDTAWRWLRDTDAYTESASHDKGTVYDTPVTSADGSRVGTVHEVLGSDAENIFHGLRVGRADKRDVMIAADHVTSLTTSAIGSDLSHSDIEALPTYDDVSAYHLASVGWLRKHLGWKKDSESDEIPARRPEPPWTVA